MYLTFPFCLYFSFSFCVHPLLRPLAFFFYRLKKTNLQLLQSKIQERIGNIELNTEFQKRIWFHAASIGESLSALPIVIKYLENNPALFVVFTIVTSSAFTALTQEIQRKCNKFIFRIKIQYSPIDTPQAVSSFLRTINPIAAIFVEGELWPNSIYLLSKKKIPIALINARISDISFRRWNSLLLKPLIKSMLLSFHVCLAQSSNDLQKLQILGCKNVVFKGNLKIASKVPNMNVDVSFFQNILNVQQRKLWIASNTHANEEEVIAQVHNNLSKEFPNLLTIIIPRHPSRSNVIHKVLEEKYSLKCVFRSLCKDKVADTTQIYIVDTIGEVRIFYECSKLVFLGGSLFPNVGGHNPIEPAEHECAVIHGPFVKNNSSLYQLLNESSKNTIEVTNGTQLTKVVHTFLKDESLLHKTGESTKEAVEHLKSKVEKDIWDHLCLHFNNLFT